MGAVCCSLLERVLDVEVFEKKQSGPNLRKLFGAYRNPDFWAVYRRFRAIDDGNGWVSYEELLQCVALAEYHLLFLWETFSQQNELISARELMTVICIFSSAPLFEKGKFLLSLFDDSHTGLNTGAEIASILHQVLTVLTKCTGVPVKVREVRDQLKGVLPDLLPKYAEAVERCNGKSELAFTTERFIGQIELEELLPSIQPTYESLPIALPPPANACAPPPPDWATPSSLEKGTAKVPEKKETKQEPTNSKKLSKAELAHLEWMSKLEEEDGEDGARMRAESSLSVEKAPAPGTKCWMVIYGTDFSTVAKNIPGFRHLFIRSVAAALGVPSGCVEVLNITRGSVIVEFLLHAPNRGGDTRDGDALKQALKEQLATSHSALRKGHFKDYMNSAELVEKPGAGGAAEPTSPAARQRSKSSHIRDQEMERLKKSNFELQEENRKLKEQKEEAFRELENTEGEVRALKEKLLEAEIAKEAALKELSQSLGWKS